MIQSPLIISLVPVIHYFFLFLFPLWRKEINILSPLLIHFVHQILDCSGLHLYPTHKNVHPPFKNLPRFLSMNWHFVATQVCTGQTAVRLYHSHYTQRYIGVFVIPWERWCSLQFCDRIFKECTCHISCKSLLLLYLVCYEQFRSHLKTNCSLSLSLSLSVSTHH